MDERGVYRLSRLRHFLTRPFDDRTRLTLAALIVIGFGLKVWGIGYGLPYLYHPDEPLGATVALNMIQSGDLNPHFFGYGSLFFYLNALAYIPYYGIGRLAGLFHSPADIPPLHMLILGVGHSLMPSQIILGRLVSVLLGTLCIPMVYWLGTRLSHRRVGLLAAAFTTISPTIVQHSQFITPNILATLTIVATLMTLARLTRESRWPSYALAGAAFGFAVASKYNAALLICPGAVAFFTLHGWETLRRPGVYISAVTAVMAFLIVTPYAVLDFPKFVEDTRFHLNYYSSASHPGMEGNTVEFYATYVIGHEGLVAFLGALPVVVYFKKRQRTGLILAAFALPYVLYVSTLRIRNDRTILLALPILFVMAADLLAMIWRRLTDDGDRRSRRLARSALAVFTALSLIYMGWQMIAQNIQQITPDAREYARQWIEANVPARSRIIAEIYSPFLDPAQRAVTYVDYLNRHPPDWYIDQDYEWLVMSSGAFGRYYAMPDRYPVEVAQYEALLARFPEAAHFDQDGFTVRILRVNK